MLAANSPIYSLRVIFVADISFCWELAVEQIENLTIAAEAFIETTNHKHRWADGYYMSNDSQYGPI